ncbi:histidine kinase dimerization/phospho-acceptor domain-containing protein [Fulvivirgaceae bacterium BMA10]|uniref:histidine kinase n=1 Tax=Splendidivirga corallicola TaxID=3051826 RepID=A0ABT8KGP8_9BACT|nr:histidine kinase dimerization/phospho-acceptor domain-containing protein [Fulvivirgaceae bacterium BMA10]
MPTQKPTDHRSIDLNVLAKVIPDTVILMNKEGEYLDIISNYGETQVPQDELIGRTVYEIGMPKPLADYFIEVIQKTISTGEIQYVEYEFPKGKQVLQYEARVIKCAEDRILAIIRNVTRLKRMEEKLKNANQKLIEIARLNSHEIRKPVASILGLLALIDENRLSMENTEIFEKISSCTAELDHVIAKIVETTHSFNT